MDGAEEGGVSLHGDETQRRTVLLMQTRRLKTKGEGYFSVLKPAALRIVTFSHVSGKMQSQNDWRN